MARYSSERKEAILNKLLPPQNMTVADLPAVHWKLMNIQKLSQNQTKHDEQIGKLETVLAQWLAGEYLGPAGE